MGRILPAMWEYLTFEHVASVLGVRIPVFHFPLNSTRERNGFPTSRERDYGDRKGEDKDSFGSKA